MHIQIHPIYDQKNIHNSSLNMYEKNLKKLTCLLTNLYIKMDKINQKETKNLLFWRKWISVG